MIMTNHPTPAELEILDILWDLKKGTVRDVYEVISSRKTTAYTTVLKTMQIMQAKGLVVRDEPRKGSYLPAKKFAAEHAEETRRLVTRQSVSRLRSQPCSARSLKPNPRPEKNSPEIRRLIDEAEAKGGKK
jgi:predicted transcriptional regulator